MERALIYDKQGSTLTLRFNRPEARNAFDQAMAESFAAAIKTAERDEEIRVVILTGSGDAFSAGQDVFELYRREVSQGGSAAAHELRERFLPIVLRLRQIGKPVIASINGIATGAGLGIALASDLRIASDSAEFIASPISIGLIPGAGISFFLPLLAGYGRAAELTFLGNRIGAGRALELGIVNRVVPAADLQSVSLELAGFLAEQPASAIELTKRALNRQILPHLQQHLSYEADLQEIAGSTAEHSRRLEAFVEASEAKRVGSRRQLS
jgi:2-(1,2-epoxy-1,2-dihydrophenyl)acetyl-CoA isomerase